jgi:hypothetical protein
MSSIIQVICLNDDNHSKSYVTRTSLYHDANHFMKECLLKPHAIGYEVREVYICNPRGELAKLDEDEFLYMFDLLDLTDNPMRLDNFSWQNREKAFDLFWENGEVWKYA